MPVWYEKYEMLSQINGIVFKLSRIIKTIFIDKQNQNQQRQQQSKPNQSGQQQGQQSLRSGTQQQGQQSKQGQQKQSNDPKKTKDAWSSSEQDDDRESFEGGGF